MTRPLQGLKVLDFSTTLPGPLASLILTEAGADVIKVERRDGGDPGRFNKPQVDGESLQFAMLNKGKRSIAVDLKNDADLAVVLALAGKADVLIEQFRPGVMARLGLGYDALAALNPGLVYCSITGYGQNGPAAQRAGHDLTYLARNGVLSLGGGPNGEPVLPPALIADIGGGTYPAVINILLALAQREKTGKGQYLDVAMAEQVFPWISRQLAVLAHDGKAPLPGTSSHTGGTPRYGLHRTADGKYLAIAPIEAKFWQNFCDAIDLPEALRKDDADGKTVREAIAQRIAAQPSDHWKRIFSGDDCCVEVVADLQEAVSDAHFASRGLFSRRVTMANGEAYPALCVPLIPDFVSPDSDRAPSLGDLPLDAAVWDERRSA
ncbi:CaiB/BaiF CoA transferase family protein [Paraburkholderia sp.]|uniref:CaiB/BaiF CoA transferase family protein n=1 Tax=Paraburkholderia sp. TaxID=1926495 RepID=UPI0039E653A6